MATLKIFHHVFTGMADIGKDSYVYLTRCDDKTMRITSVMALGKRGDRKSPYRDRDRSRKGVNQFFTDLQSACDECFRCNVKRNPVLLTQRGYPVNMISVFMGNEDSPDVLDREAQPFQALFSFPARNSAVDEHCFGGRADIIAVTVASGI